MSEKHITRYKKGMKSSADWVKINAMTDADIDYSDNPATNEEFWKDAEWVEPESKMPLTVLNKYRIAYMRSIHHGCA